MQVAQQIEKNKRASDELSEIQKKVIAKSEKPEPTENSEADFTDSDVNSEDIDEKVNSDNVDKPSFSPYNNFWDFDGFINVWVDIIFKFMYFC